MGEGQEAGKKGELVGMGWVGRGSGLMSKQEFGGKGWEREAT